MKKYDVIIFDLDGTLADSKEGVTKSVQYALEKFGIIEEDLDSLEHFIGPPLKDEFIKYYNMSEEDANKAVEYYRERYTPIGIYEVKSFKGTAKMLERLKNSGKYIAIGTSKPQMMAEEVIKYLKIDQYFDKVVGAQLHGPRQSKTAVLQALFAEIGITDKNKCLMVGDTCFDIEGANNIGIDSIGVNFGFGNEKEMLDMGALFVADTTEDVADFILK